MASAPTELGDYRLGRRIAVGGMAEVFRAERLDDGTPVALKLLLPQYARDPEFVRMLADEARMQGALVHPNLVRVLEFGTAGKQAYLALELVEGVSLRELMRAGALPAPLVLGVVQAVTRALVVVHGAGIVHRDVTPENVLCSLRGEVRLGDFGIARSQAIAGRTRTGIIKGKVHYLAPEQVKGAQADARSDLYAVGVMLFEAITGEPYLRGDSEHELLRAAEAPVLRPTRDTALDELLRALLAIDPAARPQSATELLARLEPMATDLGELATRVERARRDAGEDDAPRHGTVRVAARPPRSRTPKLVAAAGLVAIAGGGAAWWIASRPARPDAALADARSAPRDAGTAPVRDAADTTAVTADDADAVRDAGTARDAVSASVDVAHAVRDAGTARDAVSASVDVAHAVRDAGTARDAVSASVDVAHAVRDAGTATRTVRDAAVTALVVDAPAPPPDAGPDLRGALVQLRAALRARGILEADLPPDAAAALARAATATTSDAIDEARRALDAVRVDEPLLKRKLDRLGAAIRRADRTKVDGRELDRLAAAALEDLLDGRHDACNRKLNQLAQLLQGQSP